MNNDFQDGLDAFKRDDCETAYKIFLRLAEHDDPKAQFFLGALYFVGKGVQQDYGEAAGWYRLAAEQGVADAQCNLGEMLSKGLGGQQDCEEAAKWFKLAAEQGYANALQNLEVIKTACGGRSVNWEIRDYNLKK